MQCLDGKKAVVTGAASGIGRAIAVALAREGVDLYLLDVDEAGLTRVVDETLDLGVNSMGDRCDLTQPAEITGCNERMLRHYGHVDIVVNNAGVAYYGPTDRMTAQQWDWLLGINLKAPIQMTRELLPVLLSRPEAHVLNVCSIAGLVAGGRFAAYHVSKFGLVGFSEALRAEYGRRGLGVTALCPGPAQTKLYRSALSGKQSRPVPDPPRWLCTSVERTAECGVAAIRRNRRMVLVSPIAHLLWNVKRFAPGLLDFMNHFGRKRKKACSRTVQDSDRRHTGVEHSSTDFPSNDRHAA